MALEMHDEMHEKKRVFDAGATPMQGENQSSPRVYFASQTIFI